MNQQSIISLAKVIRLGRILAVASLILSILAALVFILFFVDIFSISEWADLAIMVGSLGAVIFFLRISKYLRYGYSQKKSRRPKTKRPSSKKNRFPLWHPECLLEGEDRSIF